MFSWEEIIRHCIIRYIKNIGASCSGLARYQAQFDAWAYFQVYLYLLFLSNNRGVQMNKRINRKMQEIDLIF